MKNENDQLAHFQMPQESIRWAREAIQELDTAFRGFFQSCPYGDVVEIDPETGYKVYKLRFHKPLPSALSRRATEALNNLRNAFDQTVYAGCVAVGKPPKRDIHFPWRLNPTDLQRVFDDKKCKIAPELWPAICRQEPYFTGDGYSGGNDQIRETAKTANRKHTIGLAANARVAQVRMPDIIGGPVTFLNIPMPKWDPEKNELILATIGGEADVKINHQIAFQVCLNVPGTLWDIPAQTVLGDFADRAQSFLEDVKGIALAT